MTSGAVRSWGECFEPLNWRKMDVCSFHVFLCPFLSEQTFERIPLTHFLALHLSVCVPYLGGSCGVHLFSLDSVCVPTFPVPAACVLTAHSPATLAFCPHMSWVLVAT